MLDKYLIPFIGSKGVWDIRAPFETHKGAVYACMAVRKISDYVASNEDVFELVYKPKGASQEDYEKDLAENMPIIRLQSDSGHWHDFPARYLITYPDPSGVPYQKRGIYIALPAMPVDRDLTFLTPELQDKILSTLGVPSEIKLVEASQPTMVSDEKHIATDIARRAKTTVTTTLEARIQELETANEKLIKTIQQLESYIILKHKPESYQHLTRKDLGALLIEMSGKSESRHAVTVPGMLSGMSRQGTFRP